MIPSSWEHGERTRYDYMRNDLKGGFDNLVWKQLPSITMLHFFSFSQQNADGKVRMLADTCGDLTKAWEIGLDKVVPVLGNVRCKRFSMVTEGGKVTQVNIEEDGTGLTCSLASVLKV